MHPCSDSARGLVLPISRASPLRGRAVGVAEIRPWGPGFHPPGFHPWRGANTAAGGPHRHRDAPAAL